MPFPRSLARRVVLVASASALAGCGSSGAPEESPASGGAGGESAGSGAEAGTSGKGGANAAGGAGAGGSGGAAKGGVPGGSKAGAGNSGAAGAIAHAGASGAGGGGGAGGAGVSGSGAGGAPGGGGGAMGAAGGAGGGGPAGAAGDAGATGASGAGGGQPPPDIGSIAWTSIGVGAWFKETPGATGQAAFIGYAGYNVTDPWAQAWVDELYRRHLKDLGVRWLYAVRGPQDPQYQAQEIGNSKIAKSLADHLDTGPSPIIVAAHSSGSFVAHELFHQLFVQGLGGGKEAGRVIYFDLDGGSMGLDGGMVGMMRRAYFVYAKGSGTLSPNASTMQSLGSQYAASGGAIETDSSGAGCDAGAVWCVHISLINAHPHDPSNASPQADYSSFDPGHPACTSYLSSTENSWK